MPLDVLASIAAMTKTAALKAASISGDDVAVNTKQLNGLDPSREIPALLKVMRGSLRNKAILVPIALAVSAFAPWAVLPMLAGGGLYLASEGAQNLIGKGHEAEGENGQGAKDGKALEKGKVNGALKVDFILSAEITVLTLSIVAGAPILAQLAVLAATGLAMTAGMYGLIGGLIRLDDAGKWLEKREGQGPIAKAVRQVGTAIRKSSPYIMKGISVLGTAALFVIGGELLLHGVPGAEHLVAGALGTLSANPLIQGAIGLAAETAVGLAAGFAAMPLMNIIEPKIEQAIDAVKKLAAKIPKISFRKQKTPQPRQSVPPAPAESFSALQKTPPLTPVYEAVAAKAEAAKGSEPSIGAPAPKRPSPALH